MGVLDVAEEMHKRALAIDEELGRKEGMASEYGNLGIIYIARGDLNAAEEMLEKALAIDDLLGRKEGMANQYGNLGIVRRDQDDLDGARRDFARSRDLFAEIGMPHMVAKVQGWLDELPKDS